MSRQDERAAARAQRRAEQVDTSDTTGVSVGSSQGPRVPLPQYLREVRGELRKVAWPSRDEVISFSITVLVVTAVLTAMVWGMDWFLRELALEFLS